MKKTIFYLLAGILLLGPLSCSKDEPAAPVVPTSTLATAPEAEAANDNKSGGVYKGALIGSSGIIKVTLQKGVIEAKITLDGVTRTLTTTALSGWTSGQAIVNALFASGDWKFYLFVNADGTNPYVVFDIAGHPDLEGIFGKEVSTALIMAFEGTYIGSETGTWNFVIQGTTMACLTRSSTGDFNYFEGTVNGNSISVTSDVTASGTINGNSVSGQWSAPGLSGTWLGTRTL